MTHVTWLWTIPNSFVFVPSFVNISRAIRDVVFEHSLTHILGLPRHSSIPLGGKKHFNGLKYITYGLSFTDSSCPQTWLNESKQGFTDGPLNHNVPLGKVRRLISPPANAILATAIQPTRKTPNIKLHAISVQDRDLTIPKTFVLIIDWVFSQNWSYTRDPLTKTGWSWTGPGPGKISKARTGPGPSKFWKSRTDSDRSVPGSLSYTTGLLSPWYLSWTILDIEVKIAECYNLSLVKKLTQVWAFLCFDFIF